MTIHPNGSRVVDRDTGRIGTVISGHPMTGKYLVHMDGAGAQTVVWYPDSVIDSLDSHTHILNALIREVADPALTESWKNTWTRLGLIVEAEAQRTFEVRS